MMNGSTVADGSYSGELYTSLSSTKTISSIVAIDTNATLSQQSISSWYDSANYSVLTGDLGGSYGSITSETSESSVTLKFTFSDGTYEYHKLAVKPNPVATHTIASAFIWHNLGATYRRPTTFETLAYGSYGSGDGSYSVSSTSNQRGTIQSTNGHNFALMYSPFSSVFDTSESSSTILCDTMTNYQVTYDKNAGYYVGYCWNVNGTRELYAESPTATYYLDKSSSKNWGVNHTAGTDNYSIKMFTSGMYWSTEYYGTPASNTRDYNETTDVNGNSTMSVTATDSTIDVIYYRTNEKKGYTTIGGTASVGTTTGKYKLQYTSGKDRSMTSTARINTNINLVVTDKTSNRNSYNTLINTAKSLTASNYTKTSWDAYSTSLLNLEEYLNDNTDTSSGDSLVSAVNTAYNSLQTVKTYTYTNIAGTTVSTQTVGSENELVAPSNTATTSSTYTSNNDNATHNNNYTTYSWGTPTGTSPTFTITEVATPHSDSQACSFVKSASPVSTTPATIGSPATETYLYTCSLCNQSYEGLAENVGSAVDTSALSTAIANAGNYDEADYTADSYLALTNAVTSGQTVLDTSSSTATDVSNATTAINDAITNLVYQTYTYTYINNAGTTVDTQTVKNVSELNAPSNTSAKTDYVSKGDDLNHTKTVTTYTWGTPVSNGEFSYTITEVATPVTVDEGCSFVKASEPKSTTDATIGSPATETYTFTCSICNQAYDVTENVGNPVSTTALQTAIDTAKALNSALYTAESFADVTSALNTANSVIANQSSTATQVETATTALNNAIGALVSEYTYNYYVGSSIVSTQKVTNANQLVAPDNTATGTTYTSDADGKNHTKAVTTYSWGEPVSTGDNTYSITETSATENTTVACTFERTSETPVSQTVATIGAAATETYSTKCSVCGQTSTEVVTVGNPVSTAELTNAITNAGTYSQNDYTSATYNALANAVYGAQTVLANNDSVLADVTNATTAITDAINGLVAVADYSALEAIIANVEAVKASNKADYYSTDEYQALVDKLDNALKNAYDTNGNKTLSQLEADTVDNFATELQTAYTNCMNYNKFAVTFNDCGVETTEYYEANTTITLTSEATAGTPTWTVKTGNFDTETIQNDGYSYTFKPSANTVVTLTVEGTETITPVTVNVLTKFNTVYQNLKIDGSKTVAQVLSGITAPLLFGYNFDSWLVNGKSDYDSAAQLDSLGTSVTIKPVYTAQDEWVYDSFNTATSVNDDFICWALPIDAAKSVYRVVSYAKNYNYYATGPASCFLEVTKSNVGSITLENNTTLSGGTVKADETTLNAKTPFASLRGIGEDTNSNNGQFWDKTRKKLSLVCQYTDSSELTVSSCGLELQTASGKRVVTKAKTTTSSKQYLVSYTFSTLQPSQSATLSVRSYVVYTDGQGNTVTSYSPWKSVTITA